MGPGVLFKLSSAVILLLAQSWLCLCLVRDPADCDPGLWTGFQLDRGPILLRGLAIWSLCCIWSQLPSPDLILNVTLRLASHLTETNLLGHLGSWLNLAATSGSALLALFRYGGMGPCPAGCVITLCSQLYLCFLTVLYCSIDITQSNCWYYGFLRQVQVAFAAPVESLIPPRMPSSFLGPAG